RGSVTVSPEEVKSEFLRRGRQVNLEYVRFPTRRYEADIAPTEAEIAAYAAKNDAQLKKTYDEQKFLYEKAPKQLRLRHILVKTAGRGDAARSKKAEALLARITKGEPFAKVAKEASQDPVARARGGDLGWRAHGATNITGEAQDKLFGADTKVG